MSSFRSTLLPRSHGPTGTPPLFTLPLLLEFLRSAPSAKRKMANPFLLFLPIASWFLQIWASDVLFYESFDEPFDGRWIVSRKGDYGERVNEPVKARKIHVVREMKIQRNIMTTSKDRQDPTTATVRVNLLKELREILHQTGGWHRKLHVPALGSTFTSDVHVGELETRLDVDFASSRDSTRSLSHIWNFSLSDLTTDRENLDLGAIGDYSDSPFLSFGSDLLLDLPVEDDVVEYFADQISGSSLQSGEDKAYINRAEETN
ncbi:uncharacterized protein LOC121970769 isoform X1 [Zingiber officinale]|uniref:uncharacterized protein LOC121970769 isoform X1 n=1 Tax=Zingiber officinale TaxID=94328 RepID=UPI001C4CC582|nr:uncharacterized protein LOC121970769 isoform X1 [Zingiber officinale]XP_042377647.1 uncharacterized protein LOC121970769 isoform X1 [Zingiber officinale]XP_042377648.1 uncharacterized protein LOC121970769 isoform X1 [Zingiber officinale]XP_042377649.1 uncharacterized protein LOC121970769 isoform X1 [Zingiber officinale]XP_042377650.1 uncharacterized protein LOC121970769 isoform X1 [Zingiber officinale]